MAITEPACAKVNLWLHVVGRRADGYHLLDSLAVFPAACDWLRISPDDGLSLTLAGRFGPRLVAEPDNLVMRAATALAETAGIAPRARITLEKNLPIASGIGGGSADAAAALRALSRMWRLDLPRAEVLRIATALGADVPVCLDQRPALMSGVGEILTPAPVLPQAGMVLVNPGVAVPTPAVFKARSGDFSAPVQPPPSLSDMASLVAFLAGTRNDLQAPAMALTPVIGQVLEAIAARPGCLLARMSGSGATCFGLFATDQAARAAAAELAWPGGWVWGGALAGLPERGTSA